MKWLVTSTLRDEADQRYASWLSGAGIAGKWIRPDDAMPGAPSLFDALLLTGGGDVDPVIYGCASDPSTRFVNRDRDQLEMALIQCFLNSGKPVFGICRGIQILNVAQGGKLIQHLPDHLPVRRAEAHGQVEGQDVSHPVYLVEGSRLAAALGVEQEVNSAHHQAVNPAALGRGLRVTARSPAGVVEAIEGEAIPALAVQWHPERMPPDHPASRQLLQLLVEMAVAPRDHS